MSQLHLRKYGTQTTINFVLYGITGVDLKTDAAHATGDTKIMKDEGAEANTTNGFTDEGQGYAIVLDATEMQAARIVLYVVDSATKVWLDTAIIIETYGHASAMHPFDLGTASTPQTGDNYARIGAPAGASVSADVAAVKAQTAAIETDTQDIQGRLPAALVSGRMDSNTQAMANDVITSAALAASAVTEIQSGLSTLTAAQVNTEVDTALADYDAPTHAELVSEINSVQSDIAALNNLSAAQVNAEVDTALADINLDHLVKIAVDTDFPTTVHLNSVIGHIADNGTSATFDRTTDSLEAIRDKEADIEADTQDIQGRLPAALVSGRMDSNTQAMANDVITSAALAASAVTEIQSGLSTLTAAQVNSEVDTALADYDAPTHAELVSEINSVQSDIAALNNLSSAQVQTAAAAALSAYDPPTHTELVSEINSVQSDIAALNNLSVAQVATEINDALAVDNRTEPTSVPAANAPIVDKLGWTFMQARNERRTTANSDAVRNDANNATVGTATLNDDGTTFTRSEYA